MKIVIFFLMFLSFSVFALGDGIEFDQPVLVKPEVKNNEVNNNQLSFLKELLIKSGAFSAKGEMPITITSNGNIYPGAFPTTINFPKLPPGLITGSSTIFIVNFKDSVGHTEVNIPKDAIEVTVKTDASLLSDKSSNKVVYILISGIVIIIVIVIWREFHWSGIATKALRKEK